MKKNKKLEALIKDLNSVVIRHRAIVDKYSDKEKGETVYIFKTATEDAEVNIDDVFNVISHR
jgi:hypothetical protein